MLSFTNKTYSLTLHYDIQSLQMVHVYILENVLPSDDCDNLLSKACQNFDEARQNAINEQINVELKASYAYMAMGAYFSRSETLTSLL